MVNANKRVLVVDDEKIVRQSCERTLTDAGYTVRTVGSGRDAVQACRDEPVDVMLTDLRMPEMDGLEVARAVRREFPEVRVVIITGYPSQESADRAAQLGIFDYLEKPLSPDRLSQATAEALARPPMRVPAEPSVSPDSTAAVHAKAETFAAQETTPTRAADSAHATAGNKAKVMVAGAVGFLVGAVVAYVIAPSQGLAYLAVGTAIASGTLVGVFSDAFRAGSVPTGSQPPGKHT